MVTTRKWLDNDSPLAKQIYKHLGCTTRDSRLPFPLPNMKKLTEQEFWSIMMGGYEADIYSSPIQLDDKKGTWAQYKIYYVDRENLIGGGVAVVVPYSPRGPAQYYQWRACEHEFTHRSLGNCFHGYECAKCGASYTVDSSG